MYSIRPWLYVGKYRETLDLSLLRAHQIGAMLQLAEAVEQPGITSLYLAVEDGLPLPPNLLRQGVDFTLAERQRQRTVLIACGAGISRSATFAVAALKEAENLSLLDAWREVKLRHPEAMPHPALWGSVAHSYQEDAPFLRLLDPVP